MNVYTKKRDLWWQRMLIGIIIFIIVIVLLNIFQSSIRNYFYLTSSPITKAFAQTGKNASVFFESFLNSENLKIENNNLAEENQKLLSEVLLLKESLREHQTEREALETVKNDNLAMVLTRVVGVDSSHDMILINKGSSDGIEENMSVISSQKVIYGKIFKVYKNFSQVMLISNKTSVLDVKISRSQEDQGGTIESGQNDSPSQNSSPDEAIKKPVHGAIKGNGNLSFYLDLVDYDAEIKQNDVLMTSGLEGIFPRSLLVGKITSVNKNDLKPFQTAQVEPFFNVKNVDTLFVITDYKREN